MTLTPKQRAQLKGLAHHLKPIHQVGKDGLSDATLGAILEAFNQRELIKVKVRDASPVDAREAGEEIAARLPAVEHVQTIGKTMVLYRRHPDRAVIDLVR